jgi:hypothetical protein
MALLSYHQRGVGGGQEINSPRDTYRRSQFGSQLPAKLLIAKQGLLNLYNYFVTGEDK